MAVSNTHYRKRTILVVTNNEKIGKTLSLLLTRLSYDVSLAGDAKVALESVNARALDCVIAEFMLPGTTGLELLRSVHCAQPGMPVIFLVPACDAAAESQCLGHGAAGCITKPIQAEQIYSTLQLALEPRPRASIRIEAMLPVTVNDAPVRGAAGCRVDLSEQGMYLPLQEPAPHGPVALRLLIHDRTIATEASVLYSQGTAAGEREPGIGLKFLSLSPQDREFLRCYIRDEVTRDI